MASVTESIERAERLLGSSDPNGDYIVVKVSPKSGCCCFHCWPTAWREVNSHIAPFGPIEDKGDARVGDEPRLVLECHESGPEIVVPFLAAVTVSLSLVTAVVNLLQAILKSMEKERRLHDEVTIRLSHVVAQEVREEHSVELRLPVSDRDLQIIRDALVNKLLQGQADQGTEGTGGGRQAGGE